MSEGSALLTLAEERNGCFESYDGGLSADSNVSEVWASWGGHWSGSRIRGQQTQSTYVVGAREGRGPLGLLQLGLEGGVSVRVSFRQ